MSMGEIIFLLIVFVTLGGAATAILSGSIIYAMVGLIVTMFGIAGLYIYLNSPFLAMMQILIYVGAVSVLIAFAVMLAGPMHRKPREWTNLGKFTSALGIAALSIMLILRFVGETFPRIGNPAFAVDTKSIGRAFFGELMLPFELISLLIVVGILGAVMLALFSRGKE